jgi:hypothetical protein
MKHRTAADAPSPSRGSLPRASVDEGQPRRSLLRPKSDALPGRHHHRADTQQQHLLEGIESVLFRTRVIDARQMGRLRALTQAPLMLPELYHITICSLDSDHSVCPGRFGSSNPSIARLYTPRQAGMDGILPSIYRARGFFGQGAFRARRDKTRRRGVAVTTARRRNAGPACAGRAMRRKTHVRSVSIHPAEIRLRPARAARRQHAG